MESDQYMPEYWSANKIIGKLEKALINAENILGLIQSTQIASLEAGKVTGLITSAQIKEVEAAKVAGQLTSAQIKEIEAAKIAGQLSSSQLAANSVTAEKIAALAITAGKLASESVTTEKLAANSVTAAKIVAGSITAEKLSVVELSSISANLGTITAGTLKAVKIEGGTGSFTGKLRAEEFNLTWASAIKEKIGSIRWLDSEEKARSIITSSSIGSKTYSILYLETNLSEEEKYTAGLTIDVVSPSTGEKTANGLKFKYKTYPEKLIFGDTKPSATLITEASDFLQIPKTAKQKLTRGKVEVTMGAAESTTPFVVVKHGLGAFPESITATVNILKSAGGVFAEVIAENETEFQVRATRPFGAPGASSKYIIYWTAIS